MINYTNSTTNFYTPEVIDKLQKVGCYIDGSNLCSNDTGEEFLTGNSLWLNKICKTYLIPLSVKKEVNDTL